MADFCLRQSTCLGMRVRQYFASMNLEDVRPPRKWSLYSLCKVSLRLEVGVALVYNCDSSSVAHLPTCLLLVLTANQLESQITT